MANLQHLAQRISPKENKKQNYEIAQNMSKLFQKLKLLVIKNREESHLYDKALFCKSINQSFSPADSSNASRASKISRLEM